MHHVSTLTCPSTLSIAQTLHFISVVYWDSVLARERGEKGTAPIIFKHLSDKPTPTPPQNRSSFHTHKNLQTVEKLLLKPLNDSYELLQSYQSKKLLRKRVENEEERFQRPLDPKNISCTCSYGEAPVQKLWETLADLVVAEERAERRQDGIDVCFDTGE